MTSLKKIPSEESTKIDLENIRFTIQKIGETAVGLKTRALSKVESIRKKLLDEGKKHDDEVIVRTCFRLAHFIEKEKEYGYKQIDELIDSLQRLILSLQRKKHKARRGEK
ncbi:hypothetical protein HYV57_05785 [Candidatus Peregrinibacteria bacterium]|nr:hypothetical protein [Candidatus Peregrinibacteria bacterium]